MNLTTEQLMIQRGTRILAKEADPTAKVGVDFGVTHSDTEPTVISTWDVAKLGAKPTTADATARGEAMTVTRLKKVLRNYAAVAMDDALEGANETARDALQLAYYANARHDRVLTANEQSNLDDLNAKFELVRSMTVARVQVAGTIVHTDTLDEVKARYDAAIGA